MTFPPDDVLLARGKYSTLSKERRAQTERARKVCETMMKAAHTLAQSLSGEFAFETVYDMRKCLDSLDDAGSKIVELTAALDELKSEAWDESTKIDG
jgi:hypothetical protein